MTEEHLQLIKDEIAKSVAITVNGKIDKLHDILVKQNEKTDTTAQQLATHLEKEGEFQTEIRVHMTTVKDHMEKVEPFLQGARGLKLVRDFFVWLGGLFIVYVAFKNSLKL